VDYSAKIGVGKKGGTTTCEGDQIGLSAHGSMFVYRNPASDERAEINKAHGKINWELFSPPPEKGGLKFLEEYVNYCYGDAKQAPSTSRVTRYQPE
jgi:hypothetical protein